MSRTLVDRKTKELADLGWFGGKNAARYRADLYRSTAASAPQTVTPGVASLVLTTFAPTVSTPQTVTPGVAALVLTTFAPVIALGVIPGTASLTLTTFAPVVTTSDHQTVTPTTAALTLATFAPVVTASDHQTVTPTTAALVTTGYAPVIGLAVVPATAALVLTGYEPTVTTAGGSVTVTPDTATLVLTGFAPTVTGSQPATSAPHGAALVIGPAKRYEIRPKPQRVTIGTASLRLRTYAPDVRVTTYDFDELWLLFDEPALIGAR